MLAADEDMRRELLKRMIELDNDKGEALAIKEIIAGVRPQLSALTTPGEAPWRPDLEVPVRPPKAKRKRKKKNVVPDNIVSN